MSEQQAPEKTVSVVVQNELTDEQVATLGESLATAQLDLEGMREQKKEAVAEHNGFINSQESLVHRISCVIDRGYEEEVYECVVEIDTEDMQRKFHDVNTGLIVKVENLEEGEAAQGNLPEVY